MVIIAASCSGVPENEAFQQALKRNSQSAGTESTADTPEKDASQPDATQHARPVAAASTAAASSPAGSATAKVTKWIQVADMMENSFSIAMPAGWTNAALLHRTHQSPRALVTSVSPDKNTVIYLGDPRLPVYTVPGSGFEEPYRQFNMKYPYQVAPAVSAETYFSDYLRQHFGNMEGFRITEKFDNHAILEQQKKEMAKLTMNVGVTNASYRFAYTSKGRTIHGELNGTVINMGKMWIPEVSGFCTAGDPKEVAAMMIRMGQSKATNPKWQEAQNAQHQQTMANIQQNTQRMTQQHQQRMADIQRSAAAHQQRMADLQQAADARNEQWRRNQQAQDVQHEKFLNVIKGEHTVQDSEGNTYQVDNSQEKYFIDKTNNTYIGTDATKTLDDLRELKHINIDNFEQVQIIR